LQYGENLVYHADDAQIQSMWDITFTNLDALVSLCREQNVPLIIVMFPYTFQVYDVERLNIPQQRMAGYAQERAIPFLDLLPPFSARILGENADMDDYFIDDNHPTAKGAFVAAEQVAAFIEAQLSAR